MACSCSPAQYSLPVPKLVRDPGGRLRVLEAARGWELSTRRDLTPATRGSPPPCAPSRGLLAKPRPECDDRSRSERSEWSEALPGRVGTAQPNDQDCKRLEKGSCKKVRFSDEALDGGEEPPRCSQVGAPLGAPLGAEPPGGGEETPEQPDTEDSRRGVSSDGSAARTRGAPCECPCWAAFNPQPPASLATPDIYRTCRLPKRFQYPAWFTAYNTGPKHPLYRTTSSEVGRFPPTVHTVTTIYRPVDRTLSKQYGPAGPWRNRSMCNTGSIWDIYSYNNFY